MYIRRKVFSVALDEYGDERLFSTNEIMNEDSYLEELMYSDEEGEEKKKSNRGRNIAIGTGIGAASAAGSIYGAKKLGQYLSNSRDLGEKARRVGHSLKIDGLFGKDFRNTKQKVGDILQKPADWIIAKSDGPRKYIVNTATGVGKWVSDHKLPVSIVAGTALAGGIGAYGYKKIKNRKNKKEEAE